MVFVASQMPHITRTVRLKYPNDKTIRIKNNSKSKLQHTFEIASDNKKMRPKRTSVELRGKDETDIELAITPIGRGTRGLVKYHLYVQCPELVMHEVIAVEIEFSGK
jgi:hypothetical protein